MGGNKISLINTSYYFHIMANKGEEGSPGENKGSKDVKFKGKGREAEHETYKQRELQREKPEHSEGQIAKGADKIRTGLTIGGCLFL